MNNDMDKNGNSENSGRTGLGQGPSPFIEIKSLSKIYRKGGHDIVVLKDLDLSIAEHEVVAITGVSGVGKSTLLQLMGGLDRPTAGTINYSGVDIFKKSDRNLCHFRNVSIGFVFQFHHLLNEFTAFENVLIPTMIRKGNGDNHYRERVEQLLVTVGLRDRMHHRPGELSGGEQQRVALARALVLNPKVILADEPTGNLDPATASKVHDLLIQMNEKEHSTLIFVTHNLSLVTPSTRLIKLDQGKAIEVPKHL